LPPDSWPTRERILYEASSLIGVKGYYGATTREVADAVGIQQPSIFNHFASKRDIVSALFDYDQIIPAEVSVALAAETGSPAVRLYRYVAWQTRWYHDMPFDLRGLQDALLDELELVEHRAAWARWKRSINKIVRQGVDNGEFNPDGRGFVHSVLTALSFEVIRSTHGSRQRSGAGDLPDTAASFVLRALLVDPARIDAVRHDANRSDAAGTYLT